ncbi:DNA polymerase III subunit alpha [Salmonella enterica subsp. arizonae]|uniref:DNA polymerase III subunit alpha n=1 Tax=Salmonella enterica subsp. arizonae TaxID=59203 RepID=A0A379TG98_SALER|nr:DNA polymerase III subunit alpha [Salmonella enterica subsp. arizonae]
MPVVATNDVRFLESDDFDAHEIRVAIHDGFTLDDPKRPRNYSPQQYMRSIDEMCELFADIPEALENTVEIAKRCKRDGASGRIFPAAVPDR